MKKTFLIASAFLLGLTACSVTPNITSRITQKKQTGTTPTRDERLGNQISDPAMRQKVQDLYDRDDVVVQQHVLPSK